MSATVQTGSDLSFVVSSDQLAKHKADLARRAREREAKRPLLMKCIDPNYAAACEAEKPVYDFRVQAKFDLLVGGRMEEVEIDERVAAQNEQDAWALTCDRLQIHPSIREAKPTFKQGKQLSVTDLAKTRAEETTAGKQRRKLTPPKQREGKV